MDYVILPPESQKQVAKRKMQNAESPGGGIGRRSRLKICRSQGCAGSIPVPGTSLNKEALTVFAIKASLFLVLFARVCLVRDRDPGHTTACYIFAAALFFSLSKGGFPPACTGPLSFSLSKSGVPMLMSVLNSGTNFRSIKGMISLL
jgi:hypothetical protein